MGHASSEQPLHVGRNPENLTLGTPFRLELRLS